MLISGKLIRFFCGLYSLIGDLADHCIYIMPLKASNI